MDLKSLLNQALNSDLVKQGSQTLKQSTSGMGDIANKNNLSALGAGAVGGGLIGLLMGSKKARKMTKKVAGVGGAAALGALAYKVYNDWQAGQNSPDSGSAPSSAAEISPAEATFDENQHSILILKAMIAAAKADGHVDSQEQEKIQQAVSAMGADDAVSQLVTEELNKPLDPSEVARAATTPQQASEIYLASLIVVDEQNFMEKAYLKELASQLRLEDELVHRLESQVTQ
ncbi:tellurite resistance TerB family protein [Vibrio sp. JC009]|uniref:tellurite resistance TerB family protein n=1 Tax=Vibrio sp. JC009 TaxID=2912314 RepID=UPI0023B14D25|nr:tellurite resistance TerB family protein [Vibrio sp. JC009]WED22465.1 tellurite resistance TerB family protein [Vibrio sp. JC009]